MPVFTHEGCAACTAAHEENILQVPARPRISIVFGPQSKDSMECIISKSQRTPCVIEDAVYTGAPTCTNQPAILRLVKERHQIDENQEPKSNKESLFHLIGHVNGVSVHDPSEPSCCKKPGMLVSMKIPQRSTIWKTRSKGSQKKKSPSLGRTRGLRSRLPGPQM